MSKASSPSLIAVIATIFGWRRLAFTLTATAILGLFLSTVWESPTAALFVRMMTMALVALLAFGVFEHWPERLPSWIARWALQVFGVAAVIPVSVWIFYVLSTPAGDPPFWTDEKRLGGYALITIPSLLLAPWIALSALVRQKEALVHNQALAFDLERSELERQALDARLRLLQSQVEPHFLFNTLANIRALVEAGSPQAPRVLDNLIAYLRAAVPRLQNPFATFREELHLVRAYLELMQMRMPDRLQYSVESDPSVAELTCPPTALTTLVENAIRHGIDPSEDGGKIEVSVRLQGNRCIATVSDTGIGLRATRGSLGTGLVALRERVELAYHGDATLTLSPNTPAGVRAELDIPAVNGAPA